MESRFGEQLSAHGVSTMHYLLACSLFADPSASRFILRNLVCWVGLSWLALSCPQLPDIRILGFYFVCSLSARIMAVCTVVVAYSVQ